MSVGAGAISVEPAQAQESAGWRGKGLAFALAAGIAAADLWSKHAVFAELGAHEYHWVAGSWFGFTPVLNAGIMWGLFAEFSWLLPWLRVVAAVVVLAMLRTTPRHARRLLVALGCVLGGALGNIWDGFTEGKVRDFLFVDLDVAFFDPFPVFNIADSAICVGVGLLALSLLLDKPEPGR